MAARCRGLAPPEIMMVASHKYDIRAAAHLGCQTAFVARPLEFGPNGLADTTYDDAFDLATQLGCRAPTTGLAQSGPYLALRVSTSLTALRSPYARRLG